MKKSLLGKLPQKEKGLPLSDFKLLLEYMSFSYASSYGQETAIDMLS
jgi:hypothetical protein